LLQNQEKFCKLFAQNFLSKFCVLASKHTGKLLHFYLLALAKLAAWVAEDFCCVGVNINLGVHKGLWWCDKKNYKFDYSGKLLVIQVLVIIQSQLTVGKDSH
jgi:hypothetical protein